MIGFLDKILKLLFTFGRNYVVQYVLDLGLLWATKMVVDQLAGNYAHLSMQNVVERCLKIADEDQRTCIIRELMEDSRLLELLQDPFANYVIQSALIVSKVSCQFHLQSVTVY